MKNKCSFSLFALYLSLHLQILFLFLTHSCIFVSLLLGIKEVSYHGEADCWVRTWSTRTQFKMWPLLRCHIYITMHVIRYIEEIWQANQERHVKSCCMHQGSTVGIFSAVLVSISGYYQLHDSYKMMLLLYMCVYIYPNA